MCSRGIEILEYLVSKHQNKIWFMKKHKTLTEARHLFISIYNPIKHFFDMYISSNDMPSSYKDCKFTMKFHEYMQWEIVYLTTDLEVACRYLHQFVKNCINYKRLDLLLKIVNKCKWPLAKYVAQHGFWEDKIKQWTCVQLNEMFY